MDNRSTTKGIPYPDSDGLVLGYSLVERAKKHMTVSEMREWKKLDKETSNLWKIFWVRVLHNRGHSNVTIAKQFELSESTVRRILKKEK